MYAGLLQGLMAAEGTNRQRVADEQRQTLLDQQQQQRAREIAIQDADRQQTALDRARNQTIQDEELTYLRENRKQSATDRARLLANEGEDRAYLAKHRGQQQTLFDQQQNAYAQQQQQLARKLDEEGFLEATRDLDRDGRLLPETGRRLNSTGKYRDFQDAYVDSATGDHVWTMSDGSSGRIAKAKVDELLGRRQVPVDPNKMIQAGAMQGLGGFGAAALSGQDIMPYLSPQQKKDYGSHQVAPDTYDVTVLDKAGKPMMMIPGQQLRGAIALAQGRSLPGESRTAGARGGAGQVGEAKPAERLRAMMALGEVNPDTGEPLYQGDVAAGIREFAGLPPTVSVDVDQQIAQRVPQYLEAYNRMNSGGGWFNGAGISESERKKLDKEWSEAWTASGGRAPDLALAPHRRVAGRQPAGGALQQAGQQAPYYLAEGQGGAPGTLPGQTGQTAPDKAATDLDALGTLLSQQSAAQARGATATAQGERDRHSPPLDFGNMTPGEGVAAIAGKVTDYGERLTTAIGSPGYAAVYGTDKDNRVDRLGPVGEAIRTVGRYAAGTGGAIRDTDILIAWNLKYPKRRMTYEDLTVLRQQAEQQGTSLLEQMKAWKNAEYEAQPKKGLIQHLTSAIVSAGRSPQQNADARRAGKNRQDDARTQKTEDDVGFQEMPGPDANPYAQGRSPEMRSALMDANQVSQKWAATHPGGLTPTQRLMLATAAVQKGIPVEQLAADWARKGLL